jgi:hypothetical protein
MQLSVGYDARFTKSVEADRLRKVQNDSRDPDKHATCGAGLSRRQHKRSPNYSTTLACGRFSNWMDIGADTSSLSIPTRGHTMVQHATGIGTKMPTNGEYRSRAQHYPPDEYAPSFDDRARNVRGRATGFRGVAGCNDQLGSEARPLYLLRSAGMTIRSYRGKAGF